MLYPVGQTIKINNVPFKVIGVLEAKGGGGGFGGGNNEDEVVLTPMSHRAPAARSQRGFAARRASRWSR